MKRFNRFVTTDAHFIVARGRWPFKWRYIAFTCDLPVKETHVYIGHIPIFEDII